MFGFGRLKCRQCGEALESMGQSGDRRDDLLKSSAISQNTAVNGLCTKCRARASASGQHHAVESLPPVSVPRTIAQVVNPNVEPQAKDAPKTYESGGSFKTETEKQAASSSPISFDQVTDGKGFLIWMITTKAGRNAGVIIFIMLFGLLQNCSFGEVQETTEEPTTTFVPPLDYRPPEAATAIPVGNPGSWVTTNDYPVRALAEGREGKAGFNLVINSKGRPEICTIISSSTHADLDKATCDALMKRARFESFNGQMELQNYRSNVHWKIPA